MNSRERVLKAINFEEPDRVPLDLGGSWVTGIHAEAYSRLKRAIGVNSGPVRVFDLFQMLAEVELPVVEKLGVDVLPVNLLKGPFSIKIDTFKSFDFWWKPEWAQVEVPSAFEPKVEDDGSLLVVDPEAHPSHSRARMPAEGWYFDRLDTTAMSDEVELPDLASYKDGLKRLTDAELDFIGAQARMLRRNSDKALVGGFMIGSLGAPDGMNFADWMIALISEKSFVRDMFAAKAEVTLENLQAYKGAVGENIDVVVISGADYGTQRREMFSPDLFEELFVPPYRKINRWVHENTGWKTFFHSCGSVRNIIEHFITAGVDILNPVQTSAAGMAPAELKGEFGGRIAFWGGGIDTQRTLPFGTPNEVREQVRERMNVFAPGGGFVFNTVHNLQARVPTENILAMYEAVKEFGRYPAHA